MPAYCQILAIIICFDSRKISRAVVFYLASLSAAAVWPGSGLDGVVSLVGVAGSLLRGVAHVPHAAGSPLMGPGPLEAAWMRVKSNLFKQGRFEISLFSVGPVTILPSPLVGRDNRVKRGKSLPLDCRDIK